MAKGTVAHDVHWLAVNANKLVHALLRDRDVQYIEKNIFEYTISGLKTGCVQYLICVLKIDREGIYTVDILAAWKWSSCFLTAGYGMFLLPKMRNRDLNGQWAASYNEQCSYTRRFRLVEKAVLTTRGVKFAALREATAIISNMITPVNAVDIRNERAENIMEGWANNVMGAWKADWRCP